MPATEAQIAASRANGARSRGPVTPEGKAASSRNSYKHGLAGEGIVLPLDRSAEVEARGREILADFAPRTSMGRYYARRLGELTVRVECCAEGQRKAIAHRAAHAAEAFDDARLAEAEHALGWIAAEPATHVRRLRAMPEGVNLLLTTLLALREELDYDSWDGFHGDRLANLLGHRYLDLPASRVRALNEAIGGDFQFLRPADGDGLAAADRSDWARRALADLLEAEIEGLRAHRETLDFEAIAIDRATAPARSTFDPSKEGQLARRYEAAAERGIREALRDLERVESAARETPEAPPEEEPAEEPSGSSRARVAPPSPAPRPASPTGAPSFADPAGDAPQSVGTPFRERR